MNTGHEGSLTTVHANSARDALGRLETLASMSELELPVDTIRDQINGAIDVIVQLERDSEGTRRVRQIEAVTSKHRENYTTEPVLSYLESRSGNRFLYHRLPNVVTDRLERFRESISKNFIGDNQ